MNDDTYLRVQFDDLREFDVAVHRCITRRHYQWSFAERFALNVTSGGNRSTKRYRSIKGAMDDCMDALRSFHATTERRN